MEVNPRRTGRSSLAAATGVMGPLVVLRVCVQPIARKGRSTTAITFFMFVFITVRFCSVQDRGPGPGVWETPAHTGEQLWPPTLSGRAAGGRMTKLGYKRWSHVTRG